MSSWESIPNNKKESIVKSLYRFDRVQSRKRNSPKWLICIKTVE